jgi:hypothetical protein
MIFLNNNKKLIQTIKLANIFSTSNSSANAKIYSKLFYQVKQEKSSIFSF